MIEFYSKYFDSNYKSKVNQLILDIKRLLELENIELINEGLIVIDENLQKNLDSKTWSIINSLYNTLYKKRDDISPTLLKFINKTENNDDSKLKCIDTFAGCGGLSLGLKKSGFNPILINEIEAKFLESYYFNHDI